MMRFAAMFLFLGLAACGGKSSAKPAAASSEDDKHGINADSVPVQACYEDCYTQGAKGATDWATKSEADKQAACNAQCSPANAGSGSAAQ